VNRDDRLLRPALELAFEVAKRRSAEHPPRPMPASLRPFRHFARLSNTALAAVRRAVEEDESFRAEVAAAPEADDLGAPALLWLRRPEGWEERLAEVVEEAEAPTGMAPDGRLARRLEGAERAAERERRRAEELAAQLDRSQAALAEERGRTRSLEAERRALTAEVCELAEQRSRAVTELKQVEERLARRTSELRALEEAGAAEGAPQPAPVVPEPVLLTSARERLDALAALASELRTGIARLRADLTPVPTPVVAAPRQPEALPPGVLDETLAAAEHLLRRPGLLVLVDGYNVAKLGWPGAGLASQRDALLLTLTGLVTGPGPHVRVVFDGADVDAPSPRRPGRLQVTFSPSGVSADDVILELLEGQPPDRSVAIVSNDRRVRDGARRGGARVISSDHLLTVLRRR
jgi:predicted RNA-binding protein with PIN domain